MSSYLVTDAGRGLVLVARLASAESATVLSAATRPEQPSVELVKPIDGSVGKLVDLWLAVTDKDSIQGAVTEADQIFGHHGPHEPQRLEPGVRFEQKHCILDLRTVGSSSVRNSPHLQHGDRCPGLQCLCAPLCRR